jgi:divalent metal cation (Fe/Co/Zn/Cd) transporter
LLTCHPCLVATFDVTAAPRNRVELARHARRLSWTSLAWLGFEGVATAAAGLLSGSVALLANGLDSGIEAMASVFVVWRFAAPRIDSEVAERRAQRLVSISFFLLAPYVAVEAVRALVIEHHAHTAWVGVGLSLATLSICPWLGRAKLRLGDSLARPRLLARVVRTSCVRISRLQCSSASSPTTCSDCGGSIPL